MTQFVFQSMPMQAEVQGDITYKHVVLNPGNRRIVEAANLRALQPLFEQYVSDCAAGGSPVHCYVLMASRRDRKPAGFDKATKASSGALCRDVLWDRAVEIAKQNTKGTA